MDRKADSIIKYFWGSLIEALSLSSTFIRRMKLYFINGPLRQVILHVVKPPIFWNMFVRAYRDGSFAGLRIQPRGDASGRFEVSYRLPYIYYLSYKHNT